MSSYNSNYNGFYIRVYPTVDTRSVDFTFAANASLLSLSNFTEILGRSPLTTGMLESNGYIESYYLFLNGNQTANLADYLDEYQQSLIDAGLFAEEDCFKQTARWGCDYRPVPGRANNWNVSFMYGFTQIQWTWNRL
jgi:hypothetical protein